MDKKEIVSRLPYSHPFLFVDEITYVSDTGIKGNYTFPADSYFYEGHFLNNPVTPGVILIESMAQIGLVCFGIYLLSSKSYDLKRNASVAMAETNVHFYAPVFPNEKIVVESELEYFRLNKLKCKVKLMKENGERVCAGTLAGILIPNNEK